MLILLAGGAGYIGSHTAVELLNAGHDVVIVDNYCNSSPEAVKRIEEVIGKKIPAYKVDVRIKKDLLEVLASMTSTASSTSQDSRLLANPSASPLSITATTSIPRSHFWNV